ncbi:GntR family transcriptional regulator [Arachidicoccus ginsenosidimutans]|uniref:GntR family transcriptional regulator n=1 Tax=Arachidicoccus sp. BS20 TaxID=1850526 RepID=UPI0007F0741F|nr:GntR family transcriptional regulator [Arachidicoccus sp. BS20]ANI89154.1 GntR family transcriptional regulator [Arachidicoccus sp. BS20]
MQFNNNGQAIYLQIADYICERLLLKEWKAEDKIPSVREMAVQLEVNPNTVARTYDFLKQQEIIYDKRGIGYFISPDGLKNAVAYRKQEFTDKELPNIFRTMFMLGVEVDDLKTKYEKFKKQYNS